MKNKHLIEQLRLKAKEQGEKGLDGQCFQILFDQAADRIEDQARLVRLWEARADELRLRVNWYYRHYASLLERVIRYFCNNPPFNCDRQYNRLFNHLYRYCEKFNNPFEKSRHKK